MRKEKKSKNLIAAKSELVGIIRYFKTYNRVKYFLLYLKPFLIETFFYAKLLGRFLDSKTKVTRLNASKLGTSMQLINLKLLSKFHEARPNCSRVISKTLKSHVRYS